MTSTFLSSSCDLLRAKSFLIMNVSASSLFNRIDLSFIAVTTRISLHFSFDSLLDSLQSTNEPTTRNPSKDVQNSTLDVTLPDHRLCIAHRDFRRARRRHEPRRDRRRSHPMEQTAATTSAIRSLSRFRRRSASVEESGRFRTNFETVQPDAGERPRPRICRLCSKPNVVDGQTKIEEEDKAMTNLLI